MLKRIALVAALMAAMLLTACGAGTGTASEQGDDTAYSVSFDNWGGNVSHPLTLVKGDTLQVDITREAGTVKLTITGEDKSEIYTGNWQESRAFTVGVPASGKYTVTVSGDNAKGSVDISLAE